MNAPAGPFLIGDLLFGADADVIAICEAMIPGPALPQGYQMTVGVVRNGKIGAALVFYGLQPGVEISLTMAIVDPFCCRKETIAQVMEIVWDHFGVRRLAMEIARKNKRARRFAEKFGCKLEGVRRKGYDGKQDAMCYGMLKEEWTP